MTTTPVGCPSCGTPLAGTPTCPSCGLLLSGPLAYRLWQVDQHLATLGQQRAALERQRVEILDRLRAGETADPTAPAAPVAAPPWPGAPPVPAARKESSPQQVQNTLLTLGAILLAGAGIVFTAVTYRNLGVGGRAAVLLTLTTVAALAPAGLLRRGLTASAEAVAGVAVVLTLLDVYALREAGVGEGIEASSYWAGATLVLAAALAAYSLVVPVGVTRWAAAVLSQLPLLLLLDRFDATASATAVALTAQAAADLLLAARLGRLPQDVRRLLTAAGGLLVIGGLMAAASGVESGERAAWAGFAAVAGVAAVASWLARDKALQDATALPVVPLLAAAAWALVRPRLTESQEPLVATAAALLGLQAVGLLPRGRRDGAALGALAVAAVTLLVEAEAVLQALAGPFTWLVDPWTRTAGSARGALAVDGTFEWDGTVVTLVVLAGAALAVVTAGLVLDRIVPSLVPGGALLVLSGITLPLGLATSYRDALLLQLVVAGVLSSAGIAVLTRQRLVGAALVTSGVATALVAAAWSTADQDATLVVLAVVAAGCASLSLSLPGALTGLALLLGAAELAALGADRGLAADQVGGLLLVALGVCAGLSLVLRGLHRLGAEVAAGVVALVAVACTTEDPGWLSWTLAGAGLAALAVSIRRDRRAVGLVGGLLLSASSWVRLADAGVEAPEPYVAPVAAAALVAGVLRRRSHPTASSWEVYGAALGLALVPTLLRSFADESPARGLLLLVACVSVVLIGAATRQQAPLVLGAAVGTVDALVLLAPYTNALPRWILLGGLGLLLVAIGATYEARLRDLRRLRERFDALA